MAGDNNKETRTQKFFREREEKLAKKRKWEEKRKERLRKPKDISGSFPEKPGIYKIINKRTGEVFVSYSKNMSWAIQYHDFKLKKGRHDNLDLQEDYNNGDRFNISILKEYTDYDEEVIVRDAIKFIESENSYHRGYNRSSGENPGLPSYYTGRRLDGSRNIRRYE